MENENSNDARKMAENLQAPREGSYSTEYSAQTSRVFPEAPRASKKDGTKYQFKSSGSQPWVIFLMPVRFSFSLLLLFPQTGKVKPTVATRLSRELPF